MYTIREGIKEDCIAIEDMIRELAVYEKMPNGPQIDHKVLERDGFDDNLEKRLFRTFVAQLDDNKQLIGYVLYFDKYSTWQGRGLWMEDIYVRPQYRKLGAGAALFKAVAAQADKESCDRLEWNCLDWNESSIRFYTAFGATNLTQTEGWNSFRLNRQQCRQLALSGQQSPL